MPVTKTPRARRIQALLDWLDDHGARLERCRVVAVPGQGAGLVASQDMAVDDEILFVPRDLWITVKTRHTSFGQVLRYVEQVEDLLPGGLSRLALLLALERGQPDSFFRPYLDELPAPSVPDDLDENDLALLQSPEMADWVREQRAEVEQEYARLSKVLPEHFPATFPDGLFDLATWRWAYGHSLQRSFSVDIEDEEVWVHIPGMGFCNHDAAAQNTYYAEDDGWLFEAGQPWRAGRPITIDYGSDKTSVDFFLYYGFVPPANPSDRVRLRLGWDMEDPGAAAQAAACEARGLPTECLLGADGVLPAPFLRAAEMWALGRCDAHPGAVDGLSPIHEESALDGLAAALRAGLAALPTSPAEDQVLLDEDARQGFDHAIVAYRLAFKQVLVSAADAMARRAADLRASVCQPGDGAPVSEEDADASESAADVYELIALTLPRPRM